MYILGIHCGHDATAALIKDNEILAVIQEERKSRFKHQNGFPALAIKEVLDISGITVKDVDCVAIAGNDRRIQSARELFWALSGRRFYSFAGIFKRIKTVIADNTMNAWRFNSDLKRIGLHKKRRYYFEHHLCHASSAYRNSGFDTALVVTLDGVGDDVSGSVNIGEKGSIRRIRSVGPEGSVGFLYQAVTEALDFVPVEGEYKTMGLAAYGDKTKLFDYFSRMVEYKDLDFKSKYVWESEWSFPAPTIRQHVIFKELLRDHKKEDIAAGCQAAAEDLICNFVKDAVAKTGIRTVCASGGVFLNVKANKLIREKVRPDNFYIHPDSGDGGLALGAAQELLFRLTGSHPKKKIEHVYFGREYSNKEIEKELAGHKVRFSYFPDIEKKTAELLCAGKVIGWMQGRMEMGPRALGNRSVIADPRNGSVKELINKHLKKRDWFVPFAPSVIEEDSHDYIKDFNGYAPFMIMAYDVKEDTAGTIPAVVHVDNTIRPQIVKSGVNPRYWEMIKCFKELSGVGMVLNTSFNKHGLPIVESPKDAIGHLVNSNVDILVIGNYVVERMG
jgi:carbamoyltransferase